jgi:hypothetical protein
VELEDELVVPELGEHRPVVRPVRPLERDQVPRVDRADRPDQALVERGQGFGELRAVVARDRLVQEVVHRDRRVVPVPRGELDPDLLREVLVARVGEEIRPAEGVVDVRARLPSRRAVQVEDRVQVVGAAPADSVLEQPEAVLDQLAVLVEDHAGVDREADRVVAVARDRPHVLLGEVVATEARPERGCRVGADQTRDHGLDLARARGGVIGEAPHVALREQPVADPDAAQEDGPSRLVDDLPAAAREPGERHGAKS